jgi:uncharacterized caspase-like protein
MYQRINKAVFVGAQATRKSIADALSQIIAEAGPQDTFIFYFAGHSRLIEANAVRGERQECYLLPYKVRDDENSLPENAISATRLREQLAQLKAEKQLILLNNTAPGRVFDAFAELLTGKDNPLFQTAKRDLVVLGVDTQTTSPDLIEREGHTAFTYALLQGLAGEADNIRPDGSISATELIGSLYRKLGEITQFQQLPRVKRINNDFSLVYAHYDQGDMRARRVPTGGGAKPVITKRGKHYALLVASDHYNDSNYRTLSNPCNDAQTVATNLEQYYGFERPEILNDPTIKELSGALMQYVRKQYAEDDQLLIFFAGHGDFDEETKDGLLVAKDSHYNDPEDPLKTSYLRYSVLRTLVDNIPCKHILIILDVCYGGTFNPEIARRSPIDPGPGEASVSQYVERKKQWKTRQFIASGGKEYVPDGRPGQHSPFARKLLEALRTVGAPYGVLTLGRITTYVDALMNQPVWGEFGSHQPGGEFILIAK